MSLTTAEDRWLYADARRPKLRAFLCRVTDPDRADEAVSEAMVRAGAAPITDEAAMWRWLLTTAVRIARRLWRRDVMRQRAEAAYFGGALAEQAPDEDVCDHELAVWFLARLADLGGRQAPVLLLNADDVTLTDIADHLGITKSAAESALKRARAGMRQAFAEAWPAAVIPLVWSRVRRVASAARPVSAVAVVGTVTLLASIAPEWTPAPALRQAESRQPTTKPAKGRGRSGAPAGNVRPATIPPAWSVGHPAAEAASGSGRDVSGTPSYGDSPAQGLPLPGTNPRKEKDAAAHQRDAGSIKATFGESVVRCVQRGVEVTTQHVGCR